MSSVTSKPTLYDHLGGVYSIAAVVDDFIDRVMHNPVLNAPRTSRIAFERRRAPIGVVRPSLREISNWETN